MRRKVRNFLNYEEIFEFCRRHFDFNFTLVQVRDGEKLRAAEWDLYSSTGEHLVTFGSITHVEAFVEGALVQKYDFEAYKILDDWLDKEKRQMFYDHKL